MNTSSGTRARVSLDSAVEAYHRWERHQLLADRSYRDLNHSVAMLANLDGDIAEYYRLTEEIRREYEAKRKKEKL